jgi:hypothetical protein
VEGRLPIPAHTTEPPGSRIGRLGLKKGKIPLVHTFPTKFNKAWVKDTKDDAKEKKTGGETRQDKTRREGIGDVPGKVCGTSGAR